MRIETAAPGDIPDLCDLLALLFTQEAEFTPHRQTQAQGLEQIVSNPEVGVVLLARDGDQVLGMVILLFTVSTALGGRVALLEDMIVAPNSRNAGVGTRLLEEAIALARTQGCKRITLLTDVTNDDAQRFYARQGFAASTMVPMRLVLGHPGT